MPSPTAPGMSTDVIPKPSVLVVGDFAWDMYEPGFCRALRTVGATVRELRSSRWFGPWELMRRAQQKFVIGPGVAAANAAFVAVAALQRPDLVLAWYTPWLLPLSIELAHVAGARNIALYCNDDPFGPDREKAIWRHYRRLIPHADLCLAYREVNVAEYREAGARRVGMLRSAFDPRLHRPRALTADEQRRFAADVVFVGHCEDDSRLTAMDQLLASGLKVKLFGSRWQDFARGRAWERLPPVRPVLGEDYVAAIAAAKIAVVFLSARNRDTYTRRCFEIPAIGTLMLAPRTPELLAMFREDEEAAYFSSPEELIAQARRYCRDDALRLRVAHAGHDRCLRDGHDIYGRARELLELAVAGPPDGRATISGPR